MSDAKSIRTGEELDFQKLAAFLGEKLPKKTDDLQVSQFPAGASNLTYCVKFGDEEYVLRRPPFGNRVKSAHDMSREFKVLSKLSRVYKPAPKPILYCDDESIIGSEFYMMERRRGLIIRGKLPSPIAQAETRPRGSVQKGDNHPDAETAPPLLNKEGSSGSRQLVPEAVATGRNPTVMEGEYKSAQESPRSNAETLTPVRVQNLENSHADQINVCESFIANLADLHSIDYKAAGLGDLGKPEGYTKRQVEGWTKRYQKAKTDEHASLEKVIVWLNQHIPDDDPPGLVHNDYKFDNVMLNPNDLTEIVAVLDWEMATIGSPLMDLGTTLAYWMSKDYGEEMLSMPFNPRVLMENISREELVQMYTEKSGRDVSNIVYYYVFGTFKVAVIAQQIYYRYAKGFTRDKRFANFNYFVKRLGEIGFSAINENKI